MCNATIEGMQKYHTRTIIVWAFQAVIHYVDNAGALG